MATKKETIKLTNVLFGEKIFSAIEQTVDSGGISFTDTDSGNIVITEVTE